MLAKEMVHKEEEHRFPGSPLPAMRCRWISRPLTRGGRGGKGRGMQRNWWHQANGGRMAAEVQCVGDRGCRPGLPAEGQALA